VCAADGRDAAADGRDAADDGQRRDAAVPGPAHTRLLGGDPGPPG
jgi:hypothetical protein